MVRRKAIRSTHRGVRWVFVDRGKRGARKSGHRQPTRATVGFLPPAPPRGTPPSRASQRRGARSKWPPAGWHLLWTLCRFTATSASASDRQGFGIDPEQASRQEKYCIPHPSIGTSPHQASRSCRRNRGDRRSTTSLAGLGDGAQLFFIEFTVEGKRSERRIVPMASHRLLTAMWLLEFRPHYSIFPCRDLGEQRPAARYTASAFQHRDLFV